MSKRPIKPNPKNWSEDQKQLNAIVLKIVQDRDEQIEISPMWVATETMARLRASALWRKKPLVYIACHLHVRQIARAYCADIFEPKDNEAPETAQHSMWPGLQKRYPRAHKGDAEPTYALLEALAPADVTYNVERFRKAGRSFLRHADALEAWDAARPRDVAA